MHWFYSEKIDKGLHAFDPEESKHAIRVLRLKKGDTVALTNGRGSVFRAVITDDNPKQCRMQITAEEKQEQRPFGVHIAVAPTKNISRFEWFLEKATEIGIEEITPLECEHSERIWLRNDRLEKIIIAALKQSHQAWLPRLNPMKDFAEVIAGATEDQTFIAYIDPEHQTLLKDVVLAGKNVLVLIGPEGDFSKEEIAGAISAGFKPISLGKNRLRTETAALAACHTVHLINQ
ncbi:MAG: 16S rRNA (uracil(1498)-N(3))-methyltransferase [Bacteroidales bacterium]